MSTACSMHIHINRSLEVYLFFNLANLVFRIFLFCFLLFVFIYLNNQSRRRRKITDLIKSINIIFGSAYLLTNVLSIYKILFLKRSVKSSFVFDSNLGFVFGQNKIFKDFSCTFCEFKVIQQKKNWLSKQIEINELPSTECS